jgi:large subunit ribosomal protein L29
MKDNFKNLSEAELKVKKTELAKKYMEHRFQRVIGHVENPVESRILRRKIARVNTLLGQKRAETASAVK